MKSGSYDAKLTLQPIHLSDALDYLVSSLPLHDQKYLENIRKFKRASVVTNGQQEISTNFDYSMGTWAAGTTEALVTINKHFSGNVSLFTWDSWAHPTDGPDTPSVHAKVVSDDTKRFVITRGPLDYSSIKDHQRRILSYFYLTFFLSSTALSSIIDATLSLETVLAKANGLAFPVYDADSLLLLE